MLTQSWWLAVSSSFIWGIISVVLSPCHLATVPLLVGLVFGIALGPCAFAFKAPMLGIVFTTAATNLMYAIVLLLAFAIGHSLVIIFAGIFTEVVRKFLHWNEKSGGVV